jgi:Ca2+-binding RTX toxin-like protein
MLGGASSREHMPREGEDVVVRQGRSIAVVGVFLIGCAVLVLAVGCSGTPSETSKKGQGHSPEATASEEARCEGTRTIHVDVKFQAWRWKGSFTTNDVPACRNKGGLLLGTDKKDRLAGREGADEIRGLGDKDVLLGGSGSDVLYGGRGDDLWLLGGGGDDVLYGGDGSEGSNTFPMTNRVLQGGGGEDVIYGGDGVDFIDAIDSDRYYGLHRGEGQRDKLYCGKGKDYYNADKKDYVDSSCEKKRKPYHGVA